MNKPIAEQGQDHRILSPEIARNFQSGGTEIDVIGAIKGTTIESELVELASMGGEPKEPTENLPIRYGTNRLALSEQDHIARNQYTKPKMLEAGMEVIEHPLADIGVYRGLDSELPPLLIMSHTDTVPNGDMYDGTTGVIGGIEVIRAMNDAGFRPDRDIVVASLTGEESSRFNFALFGSRALFHGLTDSELASSDKDGVSIGDLLDDEQKEIVCKPFFEAQKDIKKPGAIIELHVEQFDKLAESNKDIGVVDSIAAPVRYSVSVGDTALTPEDETPKNPKFLRLNVKGKADHSGATPMGTENRADALVETARYVSSVLNLIKESPGLEINIGDIDLRDGQAINKIPGEAGTIIRLSGGDTEKIDAAFRKLLEQAEEQNTDLSSKNGRFDLQPIQLEEIDEPAEIKFFKTSSILPRIEAALELVTSVNNFATNQKDEKVVGTIGTFRLDDDGVIRLGLDIRGKNIVQRDRCEYLIKQRAGLLQKIAEISFGKPLSGSGEPVEMDPRLVETATTAIEKFEIGSSMTMFSPAGHDAQNAARAGIPTVMLFCPSHEGAHNPDAFSTAAELEKGVKALAAVTLELCQR